MQSGISINWHFIAGLTDIFAFEDVFQLHESSSDDVCFAGAFASFL